MRGVETTTEVSQEYEPRSDGVPEDDDVIIRHVLQGDRDRFRHLVLRHQSTVLALMMRQVGEKATAEELAQEAFLKAYRNLHLFRFEAKFSTWLTRIALNTMNSYFSSRAYKEKRLTESFRCERHDQPGGVTADSAADVDEFRRLLAKIPPKLREVLVLCGLEGKSYEEAATFLEIPIGTVRSRLNKARLVLKEAYLAAPEVKR